MPRKYTKFAHSREIELLKVLADSSSSVEIYRESITLLGESLANAVLNELKDLNGSAYIACTAEDADFLAKGILNRLEQVLSTVTFSCFWNQRFKPFNISDLQVAPILKRYIEPSEKEIDSLVVVKSIISGACVVRTNLVDTIARISPKKIFIVAPVIYKGAQRRLEETFPEEIYKKFKYIFLAEDDEKNDDIVIPGVGGIVYERLGFGTQEEKNTHIPNLVRERRLAISQKL